MVEPPTPVEEVPGGINPNPAPNEFMRLVGEIEADTVPTKEKDPIEISFLSESLKYHEVKTSLMAPINF